MPPTEYTRWSHASSPKTSRTNSTHVRQRARWTVPFHLLLPWRPNGRASMASWAGVARCGTTHLRWRVRRAHLLIRSIGRRFETDSDDEKAVHVCRLSRQQLQASPRLRRSQGGFIWDASQITGGLSESRTWLPDFRIEGVMHRPVRATLTGRAGRWEGLPRTMLSRFASQWRPTQSCWRSI